MPAIRNSTTIDESNFAIIQAMKRILSLLLCVLVFQALFIEGQTTSNPENDAIFFKITGNKLQKPSYLFGTIHIMCSGEELSPKVITKAIKSVDRVLMEIDLDRPLKKLITATPEEIAEFKKKKPLSEALSQDEYELVEKKLQQYLPLPMKMFNKMPPEMLILLASTNPKIMGCKKSIASYDMKIANIAKTSKIEIDGLETVKQQLDMITDGEEFDGRELLLKFVADLEKSKAGTLKLRETYFGQNADILFDYATSGWKDDPKFQAKLLDTRNRAWVPEIEKRLSEKSYFIAIGAAHLGGENGLLKLLRERGFKIHPIKLVRTKSKKARRNPPDNHVSGKSSKRTAVSAVH